MHTLASTRVDIYAGGERSATRWLGCGSLVAPDVVLPHGHLATAGLEVLCVLSNDGGEAITGRVVAAADGSSAQAIGLDSPSGRAVQPVQPPTDSAQSLRAWVQTLAADSGCSHRPPRAPDAEHEILDRVLGRPWYCRLFPSLPGCS